MVTGEYAGASEINGFLTKFMIFSHDGPVLHNSPSRLFVQIKKNWRNAYRFSWQIAQF